jgi:hypothetical protein
MSKKFEGKKQGWGPKAARDKKLGKAGGKKPTNFQKNKKIEVHLIEQVVVIQNTQQQLTK